MSQDHLDLDLFEHLLERATPEPWVNFPDFMPGRATESVILTDDEELPVTLMTVESQADGELVVFLRNHASELMALARRAL
jgi:hypothetical protein